VAVALALWGFLIVFTTLAAVALGVGYLVAVRPSLRTSQQAP
jgi:hypothetical protein